MTRTEPVIPYATCPVESFPAALLAEWVADARRRTLDLVSDLSDEKLMGPRLDIVNPLLWEIGHAAWFQERWVLRHAAGRAPLRPDTEALYDSISIPHEVRWDLPLYSREQTFAYVRQVRDEVLDVLAGGRLTPSLAYFAALSVFHEDMHTEAFTYTRQTLAYPPPCFSPSQPEAACGFASGPLPGDVEVPGGTYHLGATPDEPFVFDNEKWAHPVEVRPFAIARAPVTQAEFAAFVDDGGYEREPFWSASGWAWRQREDARHPVYWERPPDGWRRRDFDRWLPLEPHRPVLHVNWYEADAYCRWAKRRLPTEAEWELAAAGLEKRRFPWGDDPPNSARANLDGFALSCADVAALPEGDIPSGCRQMIGNVWEWTASDFLPYPGFVADPYKEYSAPRFGIDKVLRGGCWATRGRMLRNTWRNYYSADRRDVWAGFRTCALES